MDASHDVPTLDCAYKLQEYAGRARRKRSEGKATWPGRKQVLRAVGQRGSDEGDLLALEHERGQGEPLLQPVMRGGRRLPGANPGAGARALPRRAGAAAGALRTLDPAPAYPVRVSDACVSWRRRWTASRRAGLRRLSPVTVLAP